MSVNEELVEMFAGLLEDSHLTTIEQLPATVGSRAERAGFHHVAIYVVDLQQDVLRLLVRGGSENDPEYSETELSINDTLAGRSFETLTPLSETGAKLDRWWVPLQDGAERLGVLRVDTEESGDATLRAMRALAVMVAMMVVVKREYSDSFARLCRTRPMSVAAELQWNLTPPNEFANNQVTISAVLEPAYEVGGDAFDYGIDDDVAHVAVFDAMGHDVTAGLAANLAVASYRNSRREGASLMETGEAIEATLVEHLGTVRYVTALIADLNLRTGMLTWISHGHQPPVRIRGGRMVDLPEGQPGSPLGVDLGLGATACQEQLQPGDRLVLFTDGITETHNPGGDEFGLDRFVNFIVRHNAEGLPIPETLRRLIHGILDYHGGALQDDATVLFLEWHGP
ncbi:PP2C family protein-serine/threonine phosphatase [Nocardiopsis ganjiahuensis]|uniref:PP2C family protein-serine/threonine phosphatase n=1 Tax=Nocardiopsis ganjiahuensis TaxID=239984 RepID=UPI001EF9E380|nr:PP2C family protein-serine/threonine phosphatase [Nocardiopsis ganjiahuensis]